jgi:hypothetical protein
VSGEIEEGLQGEIAVSATGIIGENMGSHGMTDISMYLYTVCGRLHEVMCNTYDDTPHSPGVAIRWGIKYLLYFHAIDN